jgi:hypothetical protein
MDLCQCFSRGHQGIFFYKNIGQCLLDCSCAGIDESLHHRTDRPDRQARCNAVDRYGPAGVYQVIGLILLHDLILRIVDLGYTALIGIRFHDTGEDNALARFEHLLHEWLVEPRSHEHAASISDEEFKDLYTLPPGLNDLG